MLTDLSLVAQEPVFQAMALVGAQLLLEIAAAILQSAQMRSMRF
jgi:hypothetical protein